MNSDNDEMGFLYSLDMSKEISYFKIMPEEVQISAKTNTVKIIYESFVIPADEDYLMSRVLAQKGLTRGFYWAASQATEKYLKAFLLMNGRSVKCFKGHPIKKLFEAAAEIDKSLLNFHITPHESISIEPNTPKFFTNFTVQSFIAELEKHGKSDNRYNASGVEFNTGHLFAMDSFSFQLRKKIGVVSIDRSFKYISSDLIQLFKKYNPWFNLNENLSLDQIPNPDFPITFSSNVTTLQFLIKHKDNPAFSIALKWLKTKMMIPKD